VCRQWLKHIVRFGGWCCRSHLLLSLLLHMGLMLMMLLLLLQALHMGSRLRLCVRLLSLLLIGRNSAEGVLTIDEWREVGFNLRLYNLLSPGPYSSDEQDHDHNDNEDKEGDEHDAPTTHPDHWCGHITARGVNARTASLPG
jgi:hypothetical protein